MKWKHLPRYWPLVQGIHQSPVNSPHKGQWRGALIFSLICAWTNDWVNNSEAGNLRRHRAHYDVTVMVQPELTIKTMAVIFYSSQLTSYLFYLMSITITSKWARWHSNRRRLGCLLNHLFRRKLKKTSKFRVTGLCEGNPPVTDGFPSQRASNAEDVSIWWRHHDENFFVSNFSIRNWCCYLRFFFQINHITNQFKY